ncbi:hypothetical protein RJ639_000268 [Escallonia herrerae]|uniref:BED-type domain-containing protein n=1 Tax=Escallonia herrerae TaxID=1293975 RepID=A0AA88XDJ1_9ASTE|nr:hypothetical protein RJ639_000268 [Escallonia herrerae]
MVDDGGEVGVGGSSNSCPLPPRPPKRKKETSTRESSQVWDHFQKIKGNTPSEPDPEIAICKYCSKRYDYTGANGTSSLWSHIRSLKPLLMFLHERTDEDTEALAEAKEKFKSSIE